MKGQRFRIIIPVFVLNLFTQNKNEMNILKIQSDGEINPIALSLMGASTKRENQNLIGRYGSGLKYAIAYFLRNNIPVTVFSGLNQITITVSPVLLGDQVFERISINGEPTSITTDLGPDWEMWHAVRELYSNALDEPNGFAKFYEDSPEEPFTAFGTEGKTTWWIETTDHKELMENWKSYFSFGEQEIFSLKEGKNIFKILPAPEKGGLAIFKNNVRVYYDPSKNAMFSYDFSSIEINEMRMVADFFEVRTLVAKCILAAKQDIIIAFLSRIQEDMFEAFLEFGHSQQELSEDWNLALQNSKVISQEYYKAFQDKIKAEEYLILPNALYKKLKNSPKLFSDIFKERSGNSGYSSGFFEQTSSVFPVENPKLEKALLKALMQYDKNIAKFQRVFTYKIGVVYGDHRYIIDNNQKTVYIDMKLLETQDRQTKLSLLATIYTAETSSSSKDDSEMIREMAKTVCKLLFNL